LWPILEASLGDLGYGLSANQIGVQKSVCLIKFNDKTYKLLNPRVIETSSEVITFMREGCLSFPGKRCNTVRFTRIVVEDDNIGQLTLSLDKDDILPIIFQHEIDHLGGKLMFDNVRRPIIRTEKKISRNALCPCGSGKKFKHCCLNLR
jgi:peptide deformylase